MANTTLTLRSERVAQTQLYAISSNLDSASSISETFNLPIGFGDCLIAEMQVTLSGIETGVALPYTRGPVITLASTVQTEWFLLRAWMQHFPARLTSWRQLDRLILWRAEETLGVTASSEDTGAADTTDIEVLIKVIRLRNLGAY